ncbi:MULTISPECIES: hypothetical protein [unclassified Wolbachia]|uniref:hypothetical protein n=1 Tax=unclassified Wolbachia TaxID=2640676 RepID=UPI002230E422|nr:MULTISPECIES: hypothetical protein [unclassified Wolbachia]
MTKVFAEWACESSVWQENVVKFLSNHRKYRICGWEFGPTLLDYLYGVKESKQPNYTKNGLSITYSIAPVVAIISFASTRRATFTAAATLGVMLFGILITVAIDYQKTRRKDTGGVISQECCVRLLEGLDEVPKYWWWPWGKKVKDIEVTDEEVERALSYSDNSFIARVMYSLFTNVKLHQLYIAKYGYIYNYQELMEGKMPNISIPKPVKDGFKKAKNKSQEAYSAISDGLSKAASGVGSIIFSTVKNEEIADKLEARSSNLIRRIFSVGDETTVTVKRGLESFKMEWLPLYLDRSLGAVRDGTKTMEDHNKYFNEQVREILKLSKVYHPDKQEQEVNKNSEQILINNVTQALRNIHDYITKDKGMVENRVVYRLFEDAPIKNIIDRGTLKVGNIVAKSELSSIAFWEGEILMRGRNEYLSSARSCVEVLSKLPKDGNVINDVRKGFDESYKRYRNLYQEKWIKNLEELSRNCMRVKELEVVKNDVDMLLKESKEQYEILAGNQRLLEGKADRVFIEPILEYCNLMNIYFKFFNVTGGKGINECSMEKNGISEEGKQNIEKLSYQELLKSASDSCNELAGKLKRDKRVELSNQGRESRTKELGKVLFKLERGAKLLEEKFKERKTLMEREEERIAAEREERRERLEAKENEIRKEAQGRKEAQEKLEQLGEVLKQEVQVRQSAEQKAEQVAQRVKQLEQALEEKSLERIAIKVCASKLAGLDEELQSAVNEESEDKIVEAAVGCTSGSPEQVINAIIEEIKINREQIIKEGKVSVGVIEAGIRSLLNQGTSLSDVNVSHGASAGTRRDSGAGI